MDLVEKLKTEAKLRQILKNKNKKKLKNNKPGLVTIVRREELLEEPLNAGYHIAVVDPDFRYPYSSNTEILRLVKMFKDNYPRQELPVRVFEWMVENIDYGQEYRGPVHYRTGLETFITREGVCGELSLLYITIMRLLGFKADYVHVSVDCYGRDVNHACAAVWLDSNYYMLVDVAYKKINPAHKEFEFVDDEKLLKSYGYIKTGLFSIF